ncbi:MAG TPA: hypothetical protein VFQ06_04910, partial [Nitrospira sp.]|nr:hypothetical protein [Nitrospira sp.]
NLVTSRGPQDLFPFVRAIKKHFAERSPMRREPPQQLRSAPQRQEPPQLMLSAMKWMPRPSFRTAIGLGAVALAVLASQSNAPRRSVPSSGRLRETAVG